MITLNTDAVKAKVLEKLGNPTNVIKVDVKPITTRTFRVNVWTKEGDGFLPCGKITHSELVELSENENLA